MKWVSPRWLIALCACWFRLQLALLQFGPWFAFRRQQIANTVCNVGFCFIIFVVLQGACHAFKDVSEFPAQCQGDPSPKQCICRAKVLLLFLTTWPTSAHCFLSTWNQYEHVTKCCFGRWEADSCAMESLYDIDLISRTVPVILDNPRSWYEIVSRSTKLGEDGVVHVQGVSRAELTQDPHYSSALLINRTASPLAW